MKGAQRGKRAALRTYCPEAAAHHLNPVQVRGREGLKHARQHVVLRGQCGGGVAST